MNNALLDLITSNRLEMLDDNLFRGRSTWGSSVRIYGGQVMSQSLSAAQQTVPKGLVLHSMHAYFMRPGDPARPVIYDVEAIRDGKSFVTRRVTARQHGHAIYSCEGSFQKVESGYEHQHPMPDIEGPETLITDEEIFARLPAEVRRPTDWPIEYRQVHPITTMTPEPMVPQNYVWLRAAGSLPDDLALHQQLLAFASDNHLLGTALRPHGLRAMAENMQVSTIDHSLWFHRPFRIDDWLMYELYSPSSSNARGFSLGRIFDKQGRLVASAAQEGLMRQWAEPKS
ncbi:MAG: acyl-CoA thioesterase II [Spongiibacteraceae bacterium]